MTKKKPYEQKEKPAEKNTVNLPLSLDKDLRTVRKILDFCSESYETMVDITQKLNKQAMEKDATINRLESEIKKIKEKKKVR